MGDRLTHLPLKLALIGPWVICATGWAYFSVALIAVKEIEDVVKDVLRG